MPAPPSPDPRSSPAAPADGSPGLSETAWRSLLAGEVPEPPAPADAPLVEWYRPLVEAGDRLVIAQLGQSIDGFIASRTGDACFVTGEEDRTHLHRMRALVDAVVVGAGTVVADDCRLTVRAVSGRSPVRVLLDPKARIPIGSKVLAEPDAPTVWLIAEAAPPVEAPAPHVEIVRAGGLEGLPPHRVLELLAERGWGRVLVEGGGITVSNFLRAGVLDRLLVTTAPMLIGDGVPGLRFEGEDALSAAISGPARRLVLGDDLCTDFDLSGLPGDRPTA